MTDPARTFLSQARSLGVIAFITVIIWLLAESESLRIEKVRFEVQFKADDTRTVHVGPNQDSSISVSLKLEGSNSRVDALVAQLRRPVILELGMEGVDGKPGEHAITLESALRAAPPFRDSPVSISDCDPPSVSTFVDTLTKHQVPVKVVIPEGQLIDGSAEANPPNVEIVYPESAFKDAPGGGAGFSLIARVDASSLTNLPEGRLSTIPNVSLELPEQLWPIDSVRINPSQVAVSVRLRSRVDVHTVPVIPVQLRLPIDATAKYDLDTDTTELRDIPVVGPIDLIEQIKSGHLAPVATIPLSAAELEKAATTGQVLTKDPSFGDIPTPLAFDTKGKLIRVLVRKRDSK